MHVMGDVKNLLNDIKNWVFCGFLRAQIPCKPTHRSNEHPEELLITKKNKAGGWIRFTADASV